MDDWEAEDEAARLTREGMDLARAGSLREAIASYDEALHLADCLPALMNRACAYFHLGELERAIRDATWALEVDEARAPMWLVRGMARERVGDAGGASEDLARYLELGASPRFRGVAERALARLAA
ncbi:MAG: hypothetical protein AB7N76_21385 [Planctomycetota bacterium]